MGTEPLVNFLVAGAQKGGTTALHDYLSEQPDVALARVKEVHFFDDEDRDWSSGDYADYHAQFDDPGGRPCGEVTPIYSYWPGSLERIAAYNPAMRIVLVLRDPVERAWSHWRMEYARGVEKAPFAWCVRQGRQRLFEAEPWGHHREFSYVERGFYGEQVERLYGLFPKEQVLILTSDALRADPGGVLNAVRGFLDLAPAPPPTPREVHAAAPIDYPSTLTQDDVAHLRGVYAADDARLRALTGISFQPAT